MATSLGRRRFLLLGFGSTTTVLLGTAAVSSAAPTVEQVWRLSADWGYAVPPKARTRCKCSACHDYAANLIFKSRTTAIAGRIHPCCVCQPYAVTVSASGFELLFPAASVRADLRATGVRATFEAAIDDLTTASPSTTVTPTPSNVPTTAVDAGRFEPAATDGSTQVEAPNGALPVTGSKTVDMLMAGAALTAVGTAVAVIAATRSEERG